MNRAISFVVLFAATHGAALAQPAACYPRIGAYSGQYEGRCPDSQAKWTVTENSIGAFGRNCHDEVWTYMREERMFRNHRTRQSTAMSDCQPPTREQLTNNRATNIEADNVLRFHEGAQRPNATPRRP